MQIQQLGLITLNHTSIYIELLIYLKNLNPLLQNVDVKWLFAILVWTEYILAGSDLNIWLLCSYVRET